MVRPTCRADCPRGRRRGVPQRAFPRSLLRAATWHASCESAEVDSESGRGKGRLIMGKDKKQPKGKSTVKVKDLPAKTATGVKGGQARPMESISLN